ncbi:MAG: hypothetical protein ACREJ3_04520, partial [Polyangiaceae bacterium]
MRAKAQRVAGLCLFALATLGTIACKSAQDAGSISGVADAQLDGGVLYDRGSAIVHAIAVDGAFVYWAESAVDGLRVRKAPKDGGGPVTDLGSWSGDLTGRLIVTDETSIYWLNGDVITRQPKAGGPSSTLPLGRKPGPGGMDGPVLVDGQLYLVDRGCWAIGHVPVDGSPPVFTDVPNNGSYAGSTSMAVDATRVYCANGPKVVAQPKAGGAVVV